MDADRGMKLLANERGVTLVWVAILLVVFCAFLGLAIDMGYMYVARGELQNAADAAALAAAAKLVEGSALQSDARAEALKFAADNLATKKPVVLASNNTNTLTPVNDVVIGNWTPSRDPKFIAGGEPLNAVQTRARRTSSDDPLGASPGGPVDLFFARVIGDKWAQIGAAASAIAARPPRAGFYIMLGRLTCNAAGPITVSPAAGSMAFTSLLSPSSNANDIRANYVCPADQLHDVEVCSEGTKVYTTNGTDSTVFKAIELDFYDPAYDRGNKAFNADGSVATWTVVVPVSSVADPSAQPSPQPVWGYAKIVMSRACGTGGGNPCSSRTSYRSPGTCAGGENDIVISSISCVSCADSGAMYGVRPSLVQ
jgi:hypothetical protein